MAAHRCCVRISANTFQPLTFQLLQKWFAISESNVTDSRDCLIKSPCISEECCKRNPCICILRIKFRCFCKRTGRLFMLTGAVLRYTQPVPQRTVLRFMFHRPGKIFDCILIQSLFKGQLTTGCPRILPIVFSKQAADINHMRISSRVVL